MVKHSVVAPGPPIIYSPFGTIKYSQREIMSTPPTLTTTTYAILGLLAVQSWTTHELVQQVDRSTRRFWPRAQSKLYEEPKKLVALGYAQATADPVGQRRRTRYSITPDGRQALVAWLAIPGAGPVLEFEQLLKIHLGDYGTKADLLANLQATRAWVIEQNGPHLHSARTYLEGESGFQHRAAINLLVGRFLTEYYVMVDRWATWANELVSSWPDDLQEAALNRQELEELIRLAELIEPPRGPEAGIEA